ncbi:hypothetical protein COV18_02695 [Candidatus Woesearchaeota archaeon CG10_big_fil_rev_8_21_14_0_10_37_12]|nr:MAG: hypothetical protein COV18_02695 [Candidatus Woesearchaeota archaeon CG10_big_fil_rev_8_21_14_0_10_37_12]
MTELDVAKLRTALIELYEQYAKNPVDSAMKNRAIQLHLDYVWANPVLSEVMCRAVNWLVELVRDTDSERPTKEGVMTLISELRQEEKAENTP